MKITLCGSTRFKSEYAKVNAQLTLAGHLVYSVAMWSHDERIEPTPAQKTTLDLVHLAKIEESDAIAVLNVGGYIGESTLREIEWALMRDKPVFWLEPATTLTLDISQLMTKSPGSSG